MAKRAKRPTTSTRTLTNRRKHKFGAKPTVVDGIKFPSKREAKRYGELKLLEQGGKISALRRQVRYRLVQVVHYVADFVYIDESGVEVVEDVKGYKTPEYKAKKKLMESQHEIVIRET
jgi:hypothetical protein